MIYADAENRRWWEGLSKMDRSEIFERIQERASSSKFKVEMAGLQVRLDGGDTPKDFELRLLRKWAS